MERKPDDIDKFVGNRVKAARLVANLTQEELGAALGVSFQQIQKYEKGTNRLSAGKLQQIADAVRRPIEWFFGSEGKKADTDIITQMAALPYGADLARSYVAITKNQHRHQIADLARSLAGA